MEITVGKPKVWEFERVFGVLDGLLRDIEGIGMHDLDQLDPNQANASLFRFLQTLFEIGASFDQSAQIKNRMAMEEVQTVRPTQLEVLQLHNERIRELMVARNNLFQDLNQSLEYRRGARAQLIALRGARTAETPPDSAESELVAEIEELDQLIADLRERIEEMDAAVAAATAAPPSVSTPSFEMTSPSTEGFSLLNAQGSGVSNFLNDMPEEVKKRIMEVLAEPNYPATKRIDNFVTLLWERLARQLAVQPDDLNRNGRNLYFMEFNTGILALGKKANHRLARVEFTLKCASSNSNAPKPRAFTLYPGQSAYNLAEFYGKSSGRGVGGVFKGIFGGGLKVNYKRQQEELRSSLVQSVYVSGFGAGSDKFGWIFGPSPFEEKITPGIRTTFALISVDEKCSQISFTPEISWIHRNKPSRVHHVDHRPADDKKMNVKLPGSDGDSQSNPGDSQANSLGLTRLQYNTVYFQKSLKPPPAVVLIELNKRIDSNLVVTVAGTPLKRVRDWRGRATSSLPPFQSNNNGSSPHPRSLLEADLPSGSEEWIAIGSNRILLSISRELAGVDGFPTIQLADAFGSVFIPGSLKSGKTEIIHGGVRQQVFPLVDELGKAVKKYTTSILETSNTNSIDNESTAESQPPVSFPPGTFVPLFVPFASEELRQERFAVALSPDVSELQVDFLDRADHSHRSGHDHRWLPSRHRAVLTDRSQTFAVPLPCFVRVEKLYCSVPASILKPLGEVVRRAIKLDKIALKSFRVQSPPSRGFLNSFGSQILPQNSENGVPAAYANARLTYFKDLQLWVEQWDPTGEHTFHSGGPVRVPPFPADTTQFREWDFFGSCEDSVIVKGCGYFEFANKQLNVKANIIGHGEVDVDKSGSSVHCARFAIPVRALNQDFVRFQLRLSMTSDLQGATYEEIPEMEISAATLRPIFDDPEVEFNWDHNGTKAWRVVFPVSPGRLHGEDKLKGGREGLDLGHEISDSRLTITVKLDEISKIPDQSLALVRGADSVKIADLPNLRRLLLPTSLQLVHGDRSGFDLTGRNAEAIQGVTLRKGSDIREAASVTNRVGSTRVEFPAELPSGAWVVFLRIGDLWLPAQDAAGKQLTVTVAKAAVAGPALESASKVITLNRGKGTVRLDVKAVDGAFVATRLKVHGAQVVSITGADSKPLEWRGGYWLASKEQQITIQLENFEGDALTVSATNPQDLVYASLKFKVTR